MSGISIQEQILENVYQVSGIRFSSVQNIEINLTPDPDRVTGLLLDMIERQDCGHFRAAFYHALITGDLPRAATSKLLLWLEQEADPVRHQQLVQLILANFNKFVHCEFFETLLKHSNRAGQGELLTRLMKRPEMTQEVRDQILMHLRQGISDTGDLNYYISLKDPVIDEWFRDVGLRSPDHRVRRISARVLRRSSSASSVLARAAAFPPDTEACFSTEVDLEDLCSVLSQVSKQFRVRLPVSKIASALDPEVEQWQTFETAEYILCLRPEDIDTVHIQLVRSRSS